MPALTLAESQLEHQALAATAFSELHQSLFRRDAESAANEDQVFEFHLRIGVASTERFIGSAQAVNEVQGHDFRQGGGVRLDRDAENPAECYQRPAFCARLRRGQECLERPSTRSPRALFVLDTNTPANRSQPADRQVGQSSDDLRPDAMRYQAARHFGAPVLLQKHIVLYLRAHVSPQIVRNTHPQAAISKRQSASFHRNGSGNVEEETITPKRCASADAVARFGGAGLDAPSERAMLWAARRSY